MVKRHVKDLGRVLLGYYVIVYFFFSLRLGRLGTSGLLSVCNNLLYTHIHDQDQEEPKIIEVKMVYGDTTHSVIDFLEF